MENWENESPARASSKTFRFRPLHVVVLIPVLAVAGLWIWRGCSLAVQRAQNAARTPSFAGHSDRLRQTRIVPTLDTPLPAGRNVVWCSSFQLAWNEVKDGVVGAPPEIPDAAELANRLNGAESSVANANPPMPIVEALQTIEFRLDRCGAALESESKLAILAAPRYFDFNRPFLVYMQKRGAEHPFFVMWVDNAELLVRE